MFVPPIVSLVQGIFAVKNVKAAAVEMAATALSFIIRSQCLK